MRATLRCGKRTMTLGSRTFVMGIVNVTPDSFSDGGRFARVDDALAQCEQLLRDGADVLDLGGESTRPGALPVTPEDEVARVLPVVEALTARGIRNVCIDTRNASTARACLEAGASWINDVSAFDHDTEMPYAVAAADAVVLMHNKKTPRTMQSGEVIYDDVTAEVRAHLLAHVESAIVHGVARERILVDPGIGFHKLLPHNLQLTRDLKSFSDLGAGVLYGASRKRFLGEIAGIDAPAARDTATLGAIAYAAIAGADIVRVHDVKRAREALAVVDALIGRC